MSLYDETAADAEQIAQEIGRTVGFRGRITRVLIADAAIGASLLDGGFIPEGNFTVKFVAADFPNDTTPKVGERVEVYGSQFRITRVNFRPPSAFIICGVEPAEK